MSFPTTQYKVYADNEFIVIEAVGTPSNFRAIKGAFEIEQYPDPTMGGGLTTAAQIKTMIGTPYAALAKNQNFLDFNGVPLSPTGDYTILETAVWAIINSNSGGGGGGDASATNQLTEIERLEQIRDNAGLKTDVAATADVGDFSLISLFKRYLERFTAYFASFGTASDAAATTDSANTGFISLFKRLLGVGIRLRNAAGTKTLEFGTQTVGNSIPVVFGENPKYAAAINYTIANTPTDFFGITGSASKKIKVVSCKIYATESQTLGGGNIRTMTLIRRSTNNTGGTLSPIVRIPLDSSNPSPTATVLAYTANPTVGTTIGTVGAHQLTHPIASTISAQYGLELIDAPIVLNTAAEGLYLNAGGVSRPNNNYSITIIWEEY